MKTKPSLFVLATAALAGCVTPFPAPSDVAHIKLDRLDSPSGVVEKIWLERTAGVLVLTGFVLKDIDPAQTHVDVSLYAADGRLLRATVAPLEPRRTTAQARRHGDARYRVVLDPLPTDTARILVQAHDGNHT